jgi:hypothetical protein
LSWCPFASEEESGGFYLVTRDNVWQAPISSGRAAGSFRRPAAQPLVICGLPPLQATRPDQTAVLVSPAVTSGRATPAIPKLNPALAECGSLAYFTFRRLPDTDGLSELGAIGHGPDGQLLSDRITKHIHTWNQHRTATPTLIAYSAGTPDHELPPAHPSSTNDTPD